MPVIYFKINFKLFKIVEWLHSEFLNQGNMHITSHFTILHILFVLIIGIVERKSKLKDSLGNFIVSYTFLYPSP